MTLGKFDILVIDIEKDKLYCRKSSCPHNKSTECMFREERPREILKIKEIHTHEYKNGRFDLGKKIYCMGRRIG